MHTDAPLDNAQEAFFGLEELFFSKTDPKGVILSGNSVFKRVSGYDWSEMQGRPHNIIRHPDMPRAVFFLLWQRLKQNLPVGAYVKNRAKDGKFYWVFALALPVEGGYLSVRSKPSSRFFPIVQGEYAALRAVELKDRLAPEDSMNRLLSRLSELGFPTYESFMTDALLEEIESRQKKIGEPPWPMAAILNKISEHAQTVKTATNNVLSSYDESRYVPINLEVQSAHSHGETKDTMGVVAAQYENMVQDINSEIGGFRVSMDEIQLRLTENKFTICANYFLEDLRSFFHRELASSDNQGKDSEIVTIEELIRTYKEKIKTVASQVIETLTTFEAICNKMQTAAVGLEIVRLTGKIEVARDSLGNSEFGGLLAQLGEFRKALGSSFNLIGQSMRHIREGSLELRSDKRRQHRR